MNVSALNNHKPDDLGIFHVFVVFVKAIIKNLISQIALRTIMYIWVCTLRNESATFCKNVLSTTLTSPYQTSIIYHHYNYCS